MYVYICNINACLYIFICIVYTHTHTRTHTQTHRHTHTHTHTHIYIYIYSHPQTDLFRSIRIYIYIYILIERNRSVLDDYRYIDMAWETGIQSQVESYQKLKKRYLIPSCLTLSIIRYVSRVKWSNPGKGVAPSPTPWCSSY